MAARLTRARTASPAACSATGEGSQNGRQGAQRAKTKLPGRMMGSVPVAGPVNVASLQWEAPSELTQPVDQPEPEQ